MSNRLLFRLSFLTAALCFLSASAEIQAETVKWRSNIDAAKIEAIQTNKLVLLHFWSSSCGPCKQLESNVFSQPQIGQLLEQNFVPVKVNADISPALSSTFNIDRVPTDVVLTPQGGVVAKLSCPPTAAGYGTQLANLSQHYRQQMAAHSIPAQAPVQSAYAGLKVGQYNNPSIATAPASSQQTFSMPQGQTAQTNGNLGSASRNSPQTTYNAYASAAANPQASRQVANAIPNRYANPPVAAAAPQYAPAQQAPTQPAAGQVTSTQAALPQQQISVPPPVTAATVAGMGSQAATQIKLPVGSPPLAFEGYCPTTLKHARKWVLGNPKYGAIHRGRTYLFTGEEQRQQFLANPDAFSPVFSGIDPVKLLDENMTVEGSRKFGYEYRGAFYLFASQESMARFAGQPDQYAAGVRQAMAQMDGLGAGTVRR